MILTRLFAATTSALLLAVLAGCGSSQGGASASSASTNRSTASASGSATAEAPAPSGATASVPDELRFTATTVDGQPFDGASLAGQDTVLWFWAPWCTVCARSAASVRSAAEASPTIRFVGVAGLSSDGRAMGEFVSRHDVGDLTHVADTRGEVYTRFGITQQHTFVLVGADGTVTTHPAYGRDVDLDALVRSTFG
ncbi:redoxin domain-containing protein [Knoellia locipacati]|uniref:redoxin domain-containing protein n=1 Tax=Knoellia locipacati TaxID=882824 RepID=UPI0038512B34